MEKFECYIESWDGIDDPGWIRAVDEEDAAQNYAKKYEWESVEYSDACIEVYVRGTHDMGETYKKYKVYTGMERTYHAVKA